MARLDLYEAVARQLRADSIRCSTAAGSGHPTSSLWARAADVETTPLRNPEYYQYELNLGAIAEVWRRDSVVASWLLDLIAAALATDPMLERFASRGEADFQDRLLSAMRFEFGGHVEKGPGT